MAETARRRIKPLALPFQSSYPTAMLVVLAFLLADLAVTFVRPYMIPRSAAPIHLNNFDAPSFVADYMYNDILDRNIFNSDGIIPENKETGATIDDESVAQLTALPMKLVGTIVHLNPGKSVATIDYSGKSDSYLPSWEKEGVFQVLKIKRRKVFFRNLANNRPEYVEIKDDGFVKLTTMSKGGGAGIVQADGNNFNIPRTELDSQLENLSELLTKARAIPNFVGGKPAGFRIIDIDPSSLFPKLGIKNGDIIKGVDGEPINSVSRIMELYQNLRERANVQIQIERDGSPFSFNYNIR